MKQALRALPLSLLTALFATAALAPAAQAQGYPSKPVRIVIGYSPGGSADAGIRPLARALEALLGQPMLVEYKPGKVRPIAVTSFTRSAAFPDVPTMDEAGVKGFDSSAWYGLLGPAGMPPEVVARINQAMAKAAEDKSLREQINATGCEVEFLSPLQTVEKIKLDLAKWGKVVKDANIKAE